MKIDDVVVGERYAYAGYKESAVDGMAVPVVVKAIEKGQSSQWDTRPPRRMCRIVFLEGVGYKPGEELVVGATKLFSPWALYEPHAQRLATERAQMTRAASVIAVALRGLGVLPPIDPNADRRTSRVKTEIRAFLKPDGTEANHANVSFKLRLTDLAEVDRLAEVLLACQVKAKAAVEPFVTEGPGR